MYKINKDLKAYNTTKLNKSISIKSMLDFLHIHHRNLYLLNSCALMAFVFYRLLLLYFFKQVFKQVIEAN